MNLNFHYFAVKVLAIEAGFDENDAQLIAEYSQFIDDFHPFLDKPMDCSCVPKRAGFLCKYIYDREVEGYVKKFIPISTGFAGVDYVLLTSKNIQENTLIPFHFIMPMQLKYMKYHKVKEINRKKYCVRKFDNSPSILKLLLKYTEYLYQGDKEKSANLIRLGIMVHIFADSYAHQKFSGYWGWENSSKTTKVIDNITNEDITLRFRSKITDNLPSIGHSNVSTIPDESYISFIINIKANKDDLLYEEEYSRNNTTEFLLAARNILNYLRHCNGKELICEYQWSVLEKKLKQGFLTTYKRVKSLTDHWSKIFNNIQFYYNADELKEPSENFFDFNICAYEVRESILGNAVLPDVLSYADFKKINIDDLLRN